MPPSTRSGGVPPPSRVYHSSPSLHQLRFPARRTGTGAGAGRVSRTYGSKPQRKQKQTTPQTESTTRQSTLTQLEKWRVPSSGNDDGVVEFSDSQEEDTDEEEEEEEKENVDEHGEEDDEPVQSGRKRKKQQQQLRAKQAAKQTFFDNDDADDDDEGDDDIPSAAKKRRSTKSTVADSKNGGKSKRRRTMGDEVPQNVRRGPGRGRASEKGRRKTMEDLPSLEDEKDSTKRKKMYHTQTITQVVRDYHMIKDSEDEDESDGDEEQGRDSFDEWVGAPSPNTSPSKEVAESHQGNDDEEEEEESTEIAEGQLDAESRQESVVPQTPAKKQIRFEIPSSTQSSQPMLSCRALERYGPADEPQVTPSKGSGGKVAQLAELTGDASASRLRKSAMKSARKLVIEDSFATEDSWGSTSTKRTPLKDVTARMMPLEEVLEQRAEKEEEEEAAFENDDATEDQATPRATLSLSKESSSVHESMSTPSKPPRRRGASHDLGGNTTPSPIKKTAQPQQTPAATAASGKKDMSNVFEIPDSEDEDSEDGFWGEDEVTVQERDGSNANEPHAEEPTQEMQNSEIRTDEPIAAEKPEQVAPTTTSGKPTQAHDTFVVGTETQGAFDELSMGIDSTPRPVAPLGTIAEDEEERIPQSSAASQCDRHISQSPVVARQTTRGSIPAPKAKASTTRAAKRIRKPIRRPVSSSSPTQPVESQRVPLSIIQGLGEVTAQTDALVIALPAQIEELVLGYRTELSLDFSLPRAVVRLWLFAGGFLRYVACVGPGSASQGRSSQWTFDVEQIYELNNPLDEADIDAEEWFSRFPARWGKLPPAIVSQLLSNLKHALFNPSGDDATSTQGITQQPPSSSPQQLPPPSQARRSNKALTPSASFSSASVSQQVEAQLRSETEQHTQSLPLQAPPSDDEDDIIVPTTPLHHRTPRTVGGAPPPRPPSFTPRPPASTSASRRGPSSQRTPRSVQPSQATTASQASMPDSPHSHTRQHSSQRPKHPPPPPPPPPQQQQQQQTQKPPPTPSIQRPPLLPSSSSLHFIDLDSPPIPPPTTNTSAKATRASNKGGAKDSGGSGSGSGTGDSAPISQLLSKSQMLSESLLTDDVNMPPGMQIWASDDE